MRTRFLLSTVVLLLISGPSQATAKGPQELTTTLAELSKWLGSDSNAKSWHAHLNTAELKKQIALGDNASAAAVGKILAIYGKKTPGLELAPFVKVRKALTVWQKELATPKPGQLPTMALALKKNFRNYTADELKQAKANVSKAMTQLEEFLAPGGKENLKSWLEFAGLDGVKKELAKAKPNRVALNRAIFKLYRNEAGLEMAAFTNVRAALQTYHDMIYFTSLRKPKTLFEAQVDRLAAALKTYVAKPNTKDAATINSTLGWLQRGRHGNEIVQVLQTHYWKPNLYGQVSEAVVKAGVEQEIKDSTKVNEMILGTDIYGTVSTKGRITVNLVPDSNQASMSILFRGKANSSNVGYNGPVTINTTGLTTISATKRLYIRPTGFQSDAAVANCRTSTTVNGLTASSGFVERIAWRRVEQSQGDAERIANQRAELRVQQRVDQKAQEMVGDININYKNRVYLPLIRHDALPKIQLSTTKTFLQLNLTQARRTQTAAPGAPPKAPAKVDVGLRVHESMVANFSESVIGGWTLTDKLLADLFKQATGEVPKELKVDLDKDPWAITFDTVQPVSVVFNKNQVTLAVRGRRFVRGPQTIRDIIQISATYKIERTKLGANLHRQGDVTVTFLRRRRLGPAQAAFKPVIRRKFERFLKPKIEFTGLKLPGRFKALGKLRLQTLASGGGWLTLGWNLPEETKNPNVRTASRPKK